MEKSVEKYLRQQVKKAGGLALKFVSPGFTGVPDRIILMPGARVYFAETKDLGKTPRPRRWASRSLCLTATLPWMT